MSLPAHPLPAERSLGGWVGGRACSKFSSGEGEPQLVWCGSRALDSRFRKGEVKAVHKLGHWEHRRMLDIDSAFRQLPEYRKHRPANEWFSNCDLGMPGRP